MHRAFTRGAVVLAAAAALGLAAGASALATSAPRPGAGFNATLSCGPACFDISSELLGPRTIFNAYVAGDTGVIPGRGGQQINMNYASDSHPNEDIIIRDVGLVATQCRSDSNPDGLLASNSVPCTTYRNLEAYELNWAPFGNDSGYCLGTLGAGYAGQLVRLVSCGEVAGSLLIRQNTNAGPSTDDCATPNPPANNGPDFSAYISGATTPRFSHPLVLTVDPGTARPINQIKLGQLNTLDGTIRDTQEFCTTGGPANPAPSPSRSTPPPT